MDVLEALVRSGVMGFVGVDALSWDVPLAAVRAAKIARSCYSQDCTVVLAGGHQSQGVLHTTACRLDVHMVGDSVIIRVGKHATEAAGHEVTCRFEPGGGLVQDSTGTG